MTARRHPTYKWRKRVLVQRKLQFRYMRYLLGLVFFFVVANSLALYVGIYKSLEAEFSEELYSQELKALARLNIMKESSSYERVGLDPSLFEDPRLLANYQKRVVAHILATTNIILVIGLLLSLLFLSAIAALLSHRIWGGLARIQESIVRLGAGDFSADIRLRENDDLREMSRDLSAMGRRLSEKIGRARELARGIERNLALTRGEPGAPVQSCFRQSAELVELLQGFRLKGEVGEGK
jgi:methyl-accepting chemotaxis protein